MSQYPNYPEHVAHLQQAYGGALEGAGFDALILHAGRGLQQRSVDDQYWPLKVNPSFAHWLPLQEADAAVVVRPGSIPLLLRPAATSIWEGRPPVESDHFWSAFEIVEADPVTFRDHLPPGKVAWIGDCTEVAGAWGIPDAAQNPPELVKALDAVRAIKTSYELDCLARASQRAARGHQRVSELFAEGGHSELDLHLAYLRATEQDATDTPYGNIVALGANAAILHHAFYGRAKDGASDQSLLVDAGATHFSYASDITRTTVRGQSPAARAFCALIEGMERTELALCDEVRPGRPYEELHDQAHERLADLLLASELCTGSSEELVAKGVTRAFFPHGLGHSLGLQVHDVGCRLVPPADANPFLRNTSTITEGQVFTIEPGCYFIDGLLEPLRASEAGSLVSWTAVNSLRPFGGIRIEDNLAVTASGVRNLTRDNWSIS